VPIITTTGTATGGKAFYIENARLQPGSGIPAVTSFTPTSGAAGASVSIAGRNFTGATAVKFNGVNASFSIGSDTTVSATVPTSATTGPISVTAAGGSGASATSFTVQ